MKKIMETLAATTLITAGSTSGMAPGTEKVATPVESEAARQGSALTDEVCLVPGYRVVCNNWPDITGILEGFLFSREAGPEGALVVFDYDANLCKDGYLLHETIPQTIRMLRDSGISVILETAIIPAADTHAHRIEEMNRLGLEFSSQQFGADGVAISRIHPHSNGGWPAKQYMAVYELDNANGIIYASCSKAVVQDKLSGTAKTTDGSFVSLISSPLLCDEYGSYAPKGDIVAALIRDKLLNRPTRVVFVDDQAGEIASFNALRELGIPVLCILNNTVQTMKIAQAFRIRPQSA
jgi:hypothetical protein